MDQSNYTTHRWLYPSITIFAILLLASGGGYGWYQLHLTKVALEKADHQITETRSRTSILEQQNADMSITLMTAQSEKEQLEADLKAQKRQNAILTNDKEDLEDQREILQKLTQTDKQLLAKYSKVYFLNENYVPAQLVTIDKAYTTQEKQLQFLKDAYPYLEELLKDAAEDGIPLRIASAYRSYNEQKALKSAYKAMYGAGANTFSADQGYSEHQLGTTVDFTTPELIGAVPAFENTTSYTWLKNNAYKYGFILSYPKSNAYYIYEPWHWRFVGVKLARTLHEDNKNFYDLDQREIDSYLIHLFD